jgi:hypothetical protein
VVEKLSDGKELARGRCSKVSEEEVFRELVLEVLGKFKSRVYKCSEVSECVDELVRKLDEEIKRASNGYCFVEVYDDCGVTVACGLLETLYVTIDYDVEEAVRVVGFRVE